MSYDIIRRAIIDRCCLSALHEDRLRIFSPHAIGQDENGEAKVVVFQYAGSDVRRLKPGGQWQCFRVNDLRGVMRNTDPWQSSSDGAWPNDCITRLDVATDGLSLLK